MNASDSIAFAGYTAVPTTHFKWFPIKNHDAPYAMTVSFDTDTPESKGYELRQAFSCSDGVLRWKPVEIATESEVRHLES